MSKTTLHIEKSWRDKLQKAFSSNSFIQLQDFLATEKLTKTIYPEEKDIFAAFNHTPFDDVKVVIIGQDPYHGANQAHGLSFSVQAGVKIPPSLKNIYKELEADIGISPPTHGNLTNWAKSGVLLLNATLTVRASEPGSHQKKGWEQFTDSVIEILNKEQTDLVFILWGKYAQEKGAIINTDKHHVIQSAHPSPFAARKGFFGSRPFSKCNDYLTKKGITPINWSL